MKFIHLTDPHLTADGTLFGIDVAARLADAVAAVSRHHGDAAFAVLTGDVTHWGEPGAYARAADILGALAMPCYPLIGNHDARAAMADGLALPESAVPGRLCYRVEAEAGVFLMLDTVLEGTHAGHLDEAQLDWLRGELTDVSARGDTGAFLFMHHPPVVSRIPGLDNIMLGNADRLEAVLAAHPGAVRHLFFGHMHRAFHGSWLGVPFSTVKATAHQIHPAFAPDAPLVASSEMPAYAVVMVSPETVAIHDVSYLEEDTAFSYDRDRDRPAGAA